MKVNKFFILAITTLSFASSALASDYITCESKSDRRSYCDVPHSYDADIRLSRIFSKSSCVEGESWGIDDRGVWVDRGCRAEFEVISSRRAYDDNHDGYDRERQQQTPAVQDEHCPSGFEPGNHRCSQGERKRGCKDMRMPGGTTCNNHGWGNK